MEEEELEEEEEEDCCMPSGCEESSFSSMGGWLDRGIGAMSKRQPRACTRFTGGRQSG